MKANNNSLGGRKIDPAKPLDFRNVASYFGVTQEDLKNAIEIVGDKYFDLQRHFKAYRNPLINRPVNGFRNIRKR